MEYTSAAGILLLIANGLFTYQGLRHSRFMEDYCFEIDGILIGKQYKRLITSGFLHVNWLHFIFNMVALMSFSDVLELEFGIAQFFGLYFLSLLGGSLLALYIHRHHGDYSAVGASGAVSGVVLAFIVLYPYSKVSLIFLPIGITSWIFGVLYILVSILGVKTRKGNIGHEAHLGGAVTGVLVAVALAPDQVVWWVVFAVVLPTVLFLILVVRNPAILLLEDYWGSFKRPQRRARMSVTKASKQEMLDRLLEKIRKQGIEGLSKKERELLEKLKNDL